MSIVVNNLSKKFKDKLAVNNISMVFEKNKITGLIGFNGSGKTTTFNMLVDFIEEYSGDIVIDDVFLSKGKNYNKVKAHEIYTKISYLSAGANPKDSTKVDTFLNDIAALYKIEKKNRKEIIKKLVDAVELTPFTNKSIKTLSKGNQQKLKIVISLMNPKLEYLFLDEPFDGFDPIMTRKIQNMIMALENVTTIITSHQMDIVQGMCHNFYLLKDGNLVDSKIDNSNEYIIIVNGQVEDELFTNLKFYVNHKKQGDTKLITINGLENFKTLNKELLKSKEFVYCSLKEKNLAESVFQKYE